MRYYKIRKAKPGFMLLIILIMIIGNCMDAQVLVASPTYTYTQDFGTSVITGSGVNITSGSANLTGWSYDAAFTSELNITVAAPTNTGGRYAYTLNSNPDRKIGGRASGGTGDIQYGVLFKNTSGQTIQSFSVSYTGYQLSLGGNTSTDVNKLTVDYVISASSIAVTAGAGTPLPALSFSQTQFAVTANTGGQGLGYPATVGTGANSGCVSIGSSIPNNSYLLIRWTDLDDPQNDPHLAIDNVKVVFFTNQTISSNTGCSFLPIELLDFYVSNNGAENEINWKVEQEENINNYMLERSENGIDFTELGIIHLSGNSDNVKAYNFSDPLPGADITYYRLSVNESNGNVSHSKVISLERRSVEWDYSHYQAADKLTVEFKGQLPVNGVMELYDLSGKLLSFRKICRSVTEMDIRLFDEGIYVVSLTTPDKTEHFKTIISKQ